MSFIKKILSKDLDYYVVIYSFLLPLGVMFQNLGVIMFFFLWLKDLSSTGTINKNKILVFFVFTLYFLFMIISVLYSQDKFSGLGKILRMMPLLLFPLFFFLRKNVNIQKNTIFKCICVFSVSISLVVIINFSLLLLKNDFELTTIIELPGRDFAQGLVNYQYLYLSYYISVSIILLIYLNTFFNVNKKYFFSLSFFAILFLFIYLFFLGSRTSLVIVFILGCFLVFLWSLKKKKWNGLLILIIPFILVVLVFYLELPLLEKVKEAINYEGQYSSLKKVWGGKMMREEIWYCSARLINDEPLFGYGIGDVQGELNNCLELTSEKPILYLGNFTFNAHNQYFQIALTSGILSSLFFLFFLFYTSIISIKRKNFIYFIFIIISSLSFITESILERNHGIIIFAFFCTLFYSYNILEKKTSNV